MLAYVVMRNRWQFIDWPNRGQNDAVSEFIRWFSLSHSQRRHADQGASGKGPVY